MTRSGGRGGPRGVAAILAAVLLAGCAVDPGPGVGTPSPGTEPVPATAAASADPVPSPPATASPAAPTGSPSPAGPGTPVPPRPAVAPAGSILVAAILGGPDGWLARVTARDSEGTVLATVDAPFSLADGWRPLEPVAASADGRLAIEVTRDAAGVAPARVAGTAVVDLVEPSSAPATLLVGELDPRWSEAGHLVTTSQLGDLLHRRSGGAGEPLVLRSRTDDWFARGISDRPDAALISVAADRSGDWMLVAWDGPTTRVRAYPEPSLLLGIERDRSPGGEQVLCREVARTLGRQCHVVWVTADGVDREAGLLGRARSGWFATAWTRRGDRAVVADRDTVRLLRLRGGRVRVDVLARLPDLGRREHWQIAGSTDDLVLLQGDGRTVAVALDGSGERFAVQGGRFVGVVPAATP